MRSVTRAPRLKLVEAGLVQGNLQGRQLVFVHIPKAAGTTFDWILDSVAKLRRVSRIRAMGTLYGQFLGKDKPESLESLGRVPIQSLQTTAIVSGHVPFSGFMDSPISETAAFVTLLRDPIERTLSHFRFGIARGGWAPDITLQELRDAGHLVDNAQVRQLAGCLDPEVESDEAMLDKALANLKEHFAVVGRAERFDSFLAVLIALYGWPAICYSNFQVGRTRISEEKLRVVREECLSLNRLDVRLYQEVCKRGDVWVNKVPDDLPSERDDTVLVVSPLVRPEGKTALLAFPRSQLAGFVRSLRQNGLDLN